MVYGQPNGYYKGDVQYTQNGTGKPTPDESHGLTAVFGRSSVLTVVVCNLGTQTIVHFQMIQPCLIPYRLDKPENQKYGSKMFKICQKKNFLGGSSLKQLPTLIRERIQQRSMCNRSLKQLPLTPSLTP